MRLHLRRIGNIGELGIAQELGRHLAVIDVNVVRNVTLGTLSSLDYERHVARLLRQLHGIADLHLITCDCDALAVHLDVPMTHELTRRERRRHELGAIDEGVEAAFEQADHILASVALAPGCFLVVAPELPLGDVAVIALELLLGLKLGAIVGELLRAPLSMLTRTIGALVDGALGPAPDAFAHAAVKLVFGVCALAHSNSSDGVKTRVRAPERARTIVSEPCLSNDAI